MARAILNGVRGYFTSNPPPGTLLARASYPRRHVVQRGDTLSQIAQQYGVSLRALRSTNKIRGDRLLVGNVLTIPSADG